MLGRVTTSTLWVWEPVVLFAEPKGSPLDYKAQCGHKMVDTISKILAL